MENGNREWKMENGNKRSEVPPKRELKQAQRSPA